MNDHGRPPVPTSFTIAIARSIALSLAAVAMAIAIANAFGTPISWSLGPLRLTSRDPLRAVTGGALLAALALALGWRIRRWRRMAGALLVIAAAITLLTRATDTTYPGGDAALIEIYTLHALRGQQVLGAYSQFGWHHPGPLSFYWLAPFYGMGKYTTYALNTGVLFGNLSALAIIAWVVATRAGRASAGFALSVSAMLVLYLTRLPNLLVNGWNPHTPVLPLAALVFVTAATLGGDRGVWPLAFILTSFVVQTHIGFALVAGALCALTIVLTLWRDWQERQTSAWLWRRPVAMVFLIELLWMFPLGEQLVHTPGNMTLIWRFFFSGRAGQSFDFAWRAWGATLAGVFEPGFRLSAGVPLTLPASQWSWLGAALAIVVVPATVVAWWRQQRFQFLLGVTSALASLAALYSVMRVVGLLGDYHIFWISALGVVNAAVVCSALVSAIDRFVPERVTRILAPAAMCIVLGYAALLGEQPMWATTSAQARGTTTSGVRRVVYEMTEAAPSLQTRRTVIRLGDGLWGEGAGIVLQMMRQHLPMTVAPDMVWMFGDALAPDGREEQLLTISRTDEHQVLSQRPGSQLIAEGGSYYADLISLADHPEFRP